MFLKYSTIHANERVGKRGEKGPFHIGADAVSFLGDSINLLIEAREKRLKLTNFDQSAPNRLICDISDFSSHK